MESTLLREWKFYSFRDLAMMICNSLKQQMEVLAIESNEKVKLLRSKLNENTIESYFYLKNYVSDLVSGINHNFHEWYERHDYVIKDFMSEEEISLFEDAILAGPKSSRLIEKLFKLDSFNKKLIEKMKQKFAQNYSYSMINDILSNRFASYFGLDPKNSHYFDDLVHIYENGWDFNDLKGNTV